MSHADMLAMLKRMHEIIKDAPARLRALAKSRRRNLALAKRLAWALRKDLLCVAGYHQPFPADQISGWGPRYLGLCALLLVDPPVVRVPRSLQGRLGKTIGGKPKLDGWDSFPGEGLLAYAESGTGAP